MSKCANPVCIRGHRFEGSELIAVTNIETGESMPERLSKVCPGCFSSGIRELCIAPEIEQYTEAQKIAGTRQMQIDASKYHRSIGTAAHAIGHDNDD